METSFANGGQISAGHAEPWAQACGGAEDPALARARGRAAAVPSARRLGAVGVGAALPPRMLAGPLRAPQPRRSPGLPAYSRDSLRALRARARHALRPAGARHPAVRHQRRDFEAMARHAEAMRALGVAARSEVGRRMPRARAGAGAFARPRRRRRLQSEGRVGRRASLHARSWRASRLRAACTFRFGTPIEAIEASRRTASLRCGLHDGADALRRRLRGRARQLQPAAARAARHPHPGLSAEGLLDHAAARSGGSRGGAQREPDRRGFQDRDLAPRQPSARRGHRRAHRLRHHGQQVRCAAIARRDPRAVSARWAA